MPCHGPHILAITIVCGSPHSHVKAPWPSTRPLVCGSHRREKARNSAVRCETLDLSAIKSLVKARCGAAAQQDHDSQLLTTKQGDLKWTL